MFGQSLLSAFGSAACTTDTDQLFTTDVQTTSLATYQLNNATTSIPSNTYPGTASNITYAAGKFGNAAVFNGSSSQIRNASFLRPISYTVSIWLKSNTTSGERMAISLNWTGSRRFAVGIKDGGIKYQNGDSGWLTIASSFSTNTWYNVIATYDSSTDDYAAFVNGVKTVTGNDTLAQTTLGSGLYLGQFGSNAGYWNGSIDQVRIFNTALPQSAVTALYNETTTTAQSASVDYVDANPNSIAYYKMSDATDQLGNYNGTASNVNFNTEGKFGFAGAFNGSSSKVVLPDAVSSSIATASAFTISMWFNISGGSGRRFLYFFGRSTYIYLEVESDNTLRAVVNASGGSVAIDDSTVLSNNVWYNAILTGSNAANLTLYLNGSSVGTASWDGTFGAASGVAVNIGNENNALYFNGSIDQVRIYNAAVSAANVTSLYNEIECPAVAVTNAFNTVLYTGNGGTQLISTVGFKPDLVWIKAREASSSHVLFDSIRGVSNVISSESTSSQSSLAPNGLTAFNNDGFTVKDIASGGNGVNGSAGGTYSGTNASYVAWNWKAGGAAVSNTDGTITSQVSADVDAGFSIVSYTGNGGNATLGSGLDQQVEMVICKSTESVSQWITYHKDLTGNVSGDNPYNLYLNGTDAQLDLTAFGAYNSFTSSVFPVTRQSAATAHNNNNNIDYIAYCFHSVSGYSKVGSYTGTGGNQTIYVGFEPRFVLIKRVTGGSLNGWVLSDSERGAGINLFANTSGAEVNETAYGPTSFTSSGFTLAQAGGNTNISGSTYIFMAIA